MYELSEVGIVEFLRDKGGRCPNTALSNQFKASLLPKTIYFYYFTVEPTCWQHKQEGIQRICQ